MDFSKMPDFFAGSLSSREAWEQKRTELKSLILNEEYGTFPSLPSPSITVERQGVNFAGKADWDRVSFEFSQGERTHTVEAELILLKNEPLNKPLFIYIDFSKETPSKYLPVEEILDSGCNIFKVFYQDVTSDDGDFENGLCALASGGGEIYGKIAVWSYFLRIMADYLCSIGYTGTLAVAGHSRLGKTALLTAAYDERFMLACVNNSGCAGASFSRFKENGEETIKDIVGTFPFWFKKKFHSYVDNEDALPFDQHMLLALVAPRCALIGCAELDYWADNDGAYHSCLLASGAWGAYGKTGIFPAPHSYSELTKDNLYPTLMGKELGYFIRSGTHFLSRYDWQKYIEKIKEL